jgi:Fic family protein
MVQEKTDEALTWLEYELRAGDQHPVLVVGAFVLCFLSICPFERGNSRLARLLAGRLLQRAGYAAIPYASLERLIEEQRCDYHTAVLTSQTQLWNQDAKIEPWLNFFLRLLVRHRERVEAKMELEREVQEFPPLQRAILETVREHGTVDAALLIRATGANRNTLKDNLRRLVRRGVLQKTGQRRGTRYRMASGDVRPVGAGKALGH